MSTKTFLSVVNFSKLTNWSIQYLIDNNVNYSDKYTLTKIKAFLTRSKIPVEIEDNKEYKRVTIKTNNGGVFLRDIENGKSIGTKKQFVIRKGQFILSKIDARNGAFGVANDEVDGAIITGNFWAFDVDKSLINPYFLSLITTTPSFIKFSKNASNGTTNRHYLQEKAFLDQEIPLPSLEEQNKIVEAYRQKIKQAEQADQEAINLEKVIEDYIYTELDIQKQEKQEKRKGLQFVKFSKLDLWGIDKINSRIISANLKYPIVSLDDNRDLYTDLFRGKSPKYEDRTKKIILNQKCNRWNEFELEYAKTVNEKWHNNIDQNAFTQKGDILINSTGEGTIGRASCVVEDSCVGLIYDSHLLLLRLNFDLVNPLYYTSVFNSDFGQNQVNNIKSAQSTKQTELGVGNLKKIQIPLPPLPKQNEIVEHITALKEKVKKLRHLAEQNREQAIKDFENTIFN